MACSSFMVAAAHRKEFSDLYEFALCGSAIGPQGGERQKSASCSLARCGGGGGCPCWVSPLSLLLPSVALCRALRGFRVSFFKQKDLRSCYKRIIGIFDQRFLPTKLTRYARQTFLCHRVVSWRSDKHLKTQPLAPKSPPNRVLIHGSNN